MFRSCNFYSTSHISSEQTGDKLLFDFYNICSKYTPSLFENCDCVLLENHKSKMECKCWIKPWERAQGSDFIFEKAHKRTCKWKFDSANLLDSSWERCNLCCIYIQNKLWLAWNAFLQRHHHSAAATRSFAGIMYVGLRLGNCSPESAD